MVVATVLGSVCRVTFLEGFGILAELQVFDEGHFGDANAGADHRFFYHAYAVNGPIYFHHEFWDDEVQAWRSCMLVVCVVFLLGQGRSVLVGAEGSAAMVVGAGDFGVLFTRDGGALCPVPFFFLPLHGLHHWLCCLQP